MPIKPQWVDELLNRGPQLNPFEEGFKLKLDKDKPSGPEVWDKLLYAVKEIYEPDYACVAGGAVRDYLLGKPAKDIDIFVKLKEGLYFEEQLLEQAECLGWKGVAMKGAPGAYGHLDNLKLVVQGVVFDNTIDLIFVPKGHTGEDVVNIFDFYINQHWYDGEIHSTKRGDRDLKKKVWSVCEGFKLDAILREHFDRVNRRCHGMYKLDEGEPWYMQFNKGKAKIV